MIDIIYFFIVLIIPIIIFFIKIQCKEKITSQDMFISNEKFKEFNLAPKIIWTYWHNMDDMPEFVRNCINTWSNVNPDYKINVLTKQTWNKYIELPYHIHTHPNFNDSHQRFSDLIRCSVLASYGGVWMDASCIITEPLDYWLFPRISEFSGVFIKQSTTINKYPVIENWFFACIKGSSFMKRWRDEFFQIANFESVDDYITSRKNMNVHFQKINMLNYLAMHISAQKILQYDKYPLQNLILRIAEDGPFKYHYDTNWKAYLGLQLACKDNTYRWPFIKFTSNERNVINENIKEFNNTECKWF